MSLRIKDSVIVTGSKLVTNDYFFQIYKNEQSMDFIENILGKKERYHCDGCFENTLTLGAKAADMVLEKTNLSGKDIDLIAFCSQYPEFTLPSQACLIHNHIRAKSNCVTFDLNANCLGMLRGLDVVNRYFKDKKGSIKHALLIGADYMSIHAHEYDPTTFASFSDGACALLLEYTENPEIGIIGSADRTMSDRAYGILFPECGLSHIHTYLGDSVKTAWTDPISQPVLQGMKEALHDVLNKHNLSLSDIDWYCGCQLSISFFNEVCHFLDIPPEKGIYVGDKYGYTGTSSPFFAYTQGVADGKIKKGDLVFFTTVGVGDTICSMLMRI